MIVAVEIERMTKAELGAEAERLRAEGDRLHAAELDFYAAHFQGRPLPTLSEWQAIGIRALAVGEPAAVRLAELHRRAP